MYPVAVSKFYSRRPLLSWALYDWANSAFATTVMAGFFPAFFQRYWSLGVDPTVSTSRLGFANGIAGFVVARWRRCSARSPTAAGVASGS